MYAIRSYYDLAGTALPFLAPQYTTRVILDIDEDDAAVTRQLASLRVGRPLGLIPLCLLSLLGSCRAEALLLTPEALARELLQHNPEVLERVAARHADLPVLMLTAHGSVPLAVEAMRRGAADFLQKPFDREELLFALDKALVGSRVRLV